MSDYSVDAFRANMRTKMLQKAVTYDELEKRTGIGKGGLNEYVHGKHRISLEYAIKIAEALDTSLSEMLTHQN